MKNIKIITLIISCVFIVVANTDIGIYTPDADSEPDTKKATKEEVGILSGMISKYTQVRNAVKFAYDEIQYFRNIKLTWEQLQSWWDTNKAKAAYLKKIVTRPPLENETLFMKMEKLEEFFDAFEDLAIGQTQEFDKIAGRMENYIDGAIQNPYVDAAGQKHRVIFAPTTDDVARKITEWSVAVPWQSIGKTQSQYEKDLQKLRNAEIYPNPDEAQKQLETQKEIADQIEEQTDIEDIIETSKEIAAHVLANSASYEDWAIQATENASQLEQEFEEANIKGINETELQTSWWMLEQLNSTNKQITHSQLELKAYLGALGLDIFEFSEHRLLVTQQMLSAKELAGEYVAEPLD